MARIPPDPAAAQGAARATAPRATTSSALPFAQLNPILRGERPPADEVEARAVLFELAKRKSGRLPAAWLVESVLAATEAADWPSRRGAMDAVLRRVGFAARDGLTVVERPATPLGR